MNKVLIVIDAQEDFTRGALRNEDAIAALPIIRKAVIFAREHGMHVYYTCDTHNKDIYFDTQEGKNLPILHCVPGTPGYKLCPEIYYLDSKDVIVKTTFGYKHWDRWFAGKDLEEIWLCGFCTDICVSANFQILKAQFPEVPITVISDACAGVTPELHEAALKVMKSCQAKIVKWSELKE